MQILQEIIDLPVYNSSIYSSYMAGLNIGVLDIETTGLSPEKSEAILIGLLTEKGGVFTLTQILADSPEEEPLILLKSLELLTPLDGLISFNGDRFDIPFLKKRCKKHLISLANFPSYSFDLYKPVRYHSDLKSMLPNLKQKTLENYMGYWQHRTDEISGSESVLLYYDYVASGDFDAYKKVLLHNRDDVINLYRLLNILKNTDIHTAMAAMGFPVKTEYGLHEIVKPKVVKNSISFTGFQSKCKEKNRNSICYADIDNPVAFDFSISSTELKSTFNIFAKDITYQGKKLLDLSQKEINLLAKELLLFTLSK